MTRLYADEDLNRLRSIFLAASTQTLKWGPEWDAFYEAATPQTLINLIDEIRLLKKELEAYRSIWEKNEQEELQRQDRDESTQERSSSLS